MKNTEYAYIILLLQSTGQTFVELTRLEKPVLEVKSLEVQSVSFCQFGIHYGNANQIEMSSQGIYSGIQLHPSMANYLLQDLNARSK
jgi:hypothetical protein